MTKPIHSAQNSHYAPFLPGKQLPFWQACKKGRHDVVELFLNRFLLDALLQGVPSPLIVACWQGSDKTTALLLNRLPKEEIQRPGPDGLKPITILAKLGKWAVVTRFQDKFGLKDVIDAAILCRNQDLFEKSLEAFQPISSVVESAYKSNAVWALDQMRTKYGRQQVDQFISFKWKSPYSLIREATEQSCTREESFLTKLTKKYPVYNERTEEKPIYQLPNSRKVSVENDILVHAKEPFCSLRNGPTSIFKIANMKLQDSFTCNHG